ncbi:MAG: MFS transporter [Ignavibacteria bacterium]|nr:MFS transporter [Ignavibacteria bacterium]
MSKLITLSIISISICAITLGLVSPTTVILLEKNHYPTWIIGGFTMIGYMCIFLFSLVSSKLIERYSLKRILDWGYVLCLIGSIGLIYWREIFLLFTFRALVGIGITFLFVATEIIINLASTEGKRGMNMNLYAVAFSIGIGIGTMFIWTVNVREFLPFVLGGFLIFISLVFKLIYYRNVDFSIPTKSEFEKFQLKSMPILALISAITYGYFESSLTMIIPVFGLRNGFTQAQTNYFLTAFIFGGITILYFIGRLSDIISKDKLILYVSMSMLFLFLSLIMVQNFIGILLIFFLIGGIFPAFYTVGLTYTAEKVEPKFIPQANGYFATFFGFGTLLGPILGSILIELDKQNGNWIFSAVICLIFSLFFLKSK